MNLNPIGYLYHTPKILFITEKFYKETLNTRCVDLILNQKKSGNKLPYDDYTVFAITRLTRSINSVSYLILNTEVFHQKIKQPYTGSGYIINKQYA
jgi:hypothetical protein